LTEIYKINLVSYKAFNKAFKYIYHVKVQPLVTQKFDQDLYPHGSELVGSLDPDPDPH
jgi:hypothetical protein